MVVDPPGRDRLNCLAATSARNPDTDLGVSLGDVQTSTSHVHNFHHDHLPSSTDHQRVAGRAGRYRSLTLGLEDTNPRFPWKPSTTMLTYRLTGTTEDSGSTATNKTSLTPPAPDDHSRTRHPDLRSPW